MVSPSEKSNAYSCKLLCDKWTPKTLVDLDPKVHIVLDVELRGERW